MTIELPWRRRSIGARLSLLYTLAALTAVALFAGITDWRLSTNFDAEHLRFVHAKVAELQVQDDGEGIEAAHVKHLFDRFYQVDAARRRGVGQGTGLGLSIVKSIVELHHGTVRVESVRGRGTSVSMHIPPALQIQSGTSADTSSPTSTHS